MFLAACPLFFAYLPPVLPSPVLLLTVRLKARVSTSLTARRPSVTVSTIMRIAFGQVADSNTMQLTSATSVLMMLSTTKHADPSLSVVYHYIRMDAVQESL